jgi:hypothetical protein
LREIQCGDRYWDSANFAQVRVTSICRDGESVSYRVARLYGNAQESEFTYRIEPQWLWDLPSGPNPARSQHGSEASKQCQFHGNCVRHVVGQLEPEMMVAASPGMAYSLINPLAGLVQGLPAGSVVNVTVETPREKTP